MDLDRAADANRAWWDAVRRQRDAGLIARSHDVAAQIMAGESGPCPEQLAFLGDVAGKRLLDLGCGDGCELVPLARLGAEATGVDNSPVQLAAAQRTADALGVRVRLVQADLMNLPEELLRGEFDLVFSSHVTAWIGDLDRWFSAVRRALVPGGVFVLRGGHPLAGFFAESKGESPTRTSYFHQGPFVRRADRSPEWNPLGEEHTFVEWSHTLGSIVTAVAQAGLRVTHLVEVEGVASQGAGYPEAFVLRATNTWTAPGSRLSSRRPPPERPPCRRFTPRGVQVLWYAEELRRGQEPRRRYDEVGPFVEEVEVDPVWNPAGEPHTTVEWKPTLGTLLTAVGHAGLRITDVAEGLDVSADEGAAVLPNEIVVRAVRDPDPTERRP